MPAIAWLFAGLAAWSFYYLVAYESWRAGLAFLLWTSLFVCSVVWRRQIRARADQIERDLSLGSWSGATTERTDTSS